MPRRKQTKTNLLSSWCPPAVLVRRWRTPCPSLVLVVSSCCPPATLANPVSPSCSPNSLLLGFSLRKTKLATIGAAAVGPVFSALSGSVCPAWPLPLCPGIDWSLLGHTAFPFSTALWGYVFVWPYIDSTVMQRFKFGYYPWILSSLAFCTRDPGNQELLFSIIFCLHPVPKQLEAIGIYNDKHYHYPLWLEFKELMPIRATVRGLLCWHNFLLCV